jgi:60 kDa SS-A/Ro ribonucleoprotein
MEAHDVNVNNRAPKVDQQLFVVALALKYGDADTKTMAENAVPAMLRTGTHLLHFVAMLDALGGWNRTKRRIIADWFETMPPDDLAYQVLKYQQRDGFRMRDVLRVAHPKADNPQHAAIFDWICGRDHSPPQDIPDLLVKHRAMNAPEYSPIQKALFGIAQGLPREALPTEALASPEVWRALLPVTPVHALIRNLATLTGNGVLDGQEQATIVVEKLTDADALRRARVHPFAVLLASMIYNSGRGLRGSKTWTPISAITAALEEAYDLAFASVQPTNKRILIAIDVSGSMSAPCMGTPIACQDAAVAMAITLARAEPHAVVVQFDTSVTRIVPVTKRTSITGLSTASGGGTDVSAPIVWAMGRGGSDPYAFASLESMPQKAAEQHFDAFVILTDNETWAGRMHPSQALAWYRRRVNPAAKLVCCAMAANHANVVDPDDRLSMGAAGLDASLPQLITEFIGT